MKNVKKASVLLIISLLLSSVFAISVFAVDTFVEEDYFVINTDILYAEISDEFDFEPYGTMSYTDTYYFTDYDYNAIQFLVLENNKAPNGIQALTNNQAVEIIEDYYGAQWSYVIENAKVTKATVNGISALRIDGAFSYYPFDSADFQEDDMYFGMCAYLLATQENIFVIVFESWEEEIDTEAFSKVISSVLVNGTYFEGDKLTVTHNFSSAPTYKEATVADAEEYDEYWGDDYYDGEMFDEEFFGAFEDGFSVIMIIICVFTLILPTVIFIALAVIFGVKYNKNKKKLDEYEARYGFRGLNSCNNPAPAQPNNNGYNSQAYGAQGISTQPYGPQGYGAGYNAQPPVPQMNTPVPPVNMPTPPVQSPTPPVQPTVNPQPSSNLAPELQDSKADENK